MTKRKLTLIIADVVLLVVVIINTIRANKDTAKTFEFKETPDSITIVNEKGVVNLVYENDEWFVGDEKYPATETTVDSIIETLSYIRVLDKVGSVNNDATLTRYELNEGKKFTAVASLKGKVLRTVEVGKSATADSQAYITIDGGKDIYLATGNLKNGLNRTVNEIRSRVVWNFEKNEVNSVTITPASGETWSLSRMGSGEDITWNASGVTLDVDPIKAAEWLNGFAGVVTPVWHEKDEDLGGQKIISSKIGIGFKTITIDIYEIPAATEEDKPTYWAKCSEVPYSFEVAAYVVQKFQKNPSELAK